MKAWLQLPADAVCVACGIDVSSNSRGRRALGKDSKGSPEDLERVLSTWRELLQVLGRDPPDPSKAKLCSKCFNRYKKYHSSKSSCHDELNSFNWEKLFCELKTHAPTLLSLFYACTKSGSRNRDSIVGMCISMLLKLRYCRMNLVQKLVMVVILAGRSSKLVRVVTEL